MYKHGTYFVYFCLISNLSGTLIYKFKLSASYETNDSTAITTWRWRGYYRHNVTSSAVRQYLSTNSAKSTFLRNYGLVVKVTSSKSPTEQNLPARQSDISVLQAQVQSIMDIVSETRIVVDKCHEDMNGFETRLSDICFVVQEQWQKKGEDRAAPSDSTAWNISTQVKWSVLLYIWWCFYLQGL